MVGLERDSRDGEKRMKHGGTVGRMSHGWMWERGKEKN